MKYDATVDEMMLLYGDVKSLGGCISATTLASVMTQFPIDDIVQDFD